MRSFYIAVGLAVVIGLLFLVWNSLRKSSERTEEPDPTAVSATREISDLYLDLRSQALEFPPEQFDLKATSGRPEVYGVVMDCGGGGGVVSFVSFSNGDASMYTSTGGGIIGGAGRDRVKKSSAEFVRQSQNYLDKANKSDDVAVANDRRVKFFFLTTNGRYIAEETLVNFDNGSSPLLGLFEKANELITELREVSEEMENEKR